MELSEPVDPEKLRADVKRLLFKDCKDTTTWDHLGNLDPVRKQEEKHVKIADPSENTYHDDRLQYVVLPPSLSLLYEVTQDKLHADGKTNCDLQTLLEYAAKPMEVMDAHDRLYQHAVDKRNRLLAEAKERARLAKEEEDGHCTFRPAISEHAGRVQSKAQAEGGYYQECLDWRKATAKKLKKKVEKEEREKWEDTMAPWEMDKRSKMIVERKKKREKEERKQTRARTQSPGSMGRRIITPRQHRKAIAEEMEYPSFTPLTNSSARKEMLLQLGSGFKAGDLEDGGDGGAGNMSFVGGELHQDATTVIENLQERIEKDIKDRRARQAQRAEEFRLQKTRAQFDRITGQPLFRPNAMPIIRDKNGGERKFIELSKKEREQVLKNFRAHDVDFVPAIAQKAYNVGKTRDIDECVKNMLELHNTANKKLAKKRRKAAAEEVEECRFKPKIDKKSSDMVSNSDRGYSGYLATTKGQLHREGRGSVHEIQSTTTHDANGNKKKKLTDEQQALLIRRQEAFAEDVKRHRAKSEKSAEREELAECSFKPKLNRASARMMEEAEKRMGSHSAPVVPLQPQRNSAKNQHADPRSLQPNTERSKSALVKPSGSSVGGTTPLGTPHNTSGSMRRRQAGGSLQNTSFNDRSLRSESGADYMSPSLQPSDHHHHQGGSTPANYGGSPYAQQPMSELGLDDLEGLLADWNSFSRSLSQPSQSVH